MKRAAVIALLTVLSVLNLYAAYSPSWAKRYFPLPFKSDSLSKAVHIFFGVALVLCVLLLVYSAFMPTIQND